MTNTEINENAVYQFCQDRWDYYQAKDGGYYPSKHDPKVFEDVSKKFCITTEVAKEIFGKVDKVHVQQQHIEKMSKAELAQMFDKIIKGNAETPWGAKEIKNRSK